MIYIGSRLLGHKVYFKCIRCVQELVTPFYIVTYYIKWGNYFLDIRYILETYRKSARNLPLGRGQGRVCHVDRKVWFVGLAGQLVAGVAQPHFGQEGSSSS